MDLSKAFDCVNHRLLCRKLEACGVRGLGLRWFQSYLEGRKQLVEVQGVRSGMGVITRGVPQGSILGPLLFIVYINELVVQKQHSWDIKNSGTKRPYLAQILSCLRYAIFRKIDRLHSNASAPLKEVKVVSMCKFLFCYEYLACE